MRCGFLLQVAGSTVTEPSSAGVFASEILPALPSGGFAYTGVFAAYAQVFVPQPSPLTEDNAWAFVCAHDPVNKDLGGAARALSVCTVRYDDFTPNTRFLSAPVLAAGHVSMIDAFRHAEVMSQQPPEIVVNVPLTDSLGEAAVTGNTIDVVFVWAWKDALGAIHRSGPSDPLTYTEGGTSAGYIDDRFVVLAIPPAFAWRQDPDLGPNDVWLEAYHSPADGNDSTGTDTRLADGLFYRSATVNIGTTSGTSPTRIRGTSAYTNSHIPLAELESTTVPGLSRPVFVSPSNPWTNDFSQPGLYSNNEKVHVPAPPPLSVTGTVDRIWVADSEDRTRVWYSGPLNPFEAPWFSSDFVLYVPSEGGEVVALGSTQDLVVIFTKEHTYGLTAIDGPDASGAGLFPPLRKISDAVSCNNPASIVETDIGLFFESEYGIYVISPDGGVSHVGARIGGLLTGRTIVSSCVIPKDKLVIFDCSDGVGLAYDYERDAWVEYRYIGTSLESSCEAAGRHVILADNSGLQVYRDSDAEGVEDFDSHFDTGWIQLSGSIEGYKRVREVILTGSLSGDAIPGSPGANDDAGDIVVTVYHNYDNSQVETYTIRVIDLDNINPLRTRIPMNRQKVSAVRIRVGYTQPNSAGGSDYYQRLTISGITLGVGVKQGPAKLNPGGGSAIS